jgi:preprotein translocase subunit SecA
VVTVNDYLARRDSAQMGKLYNYLGLTVDVVYPGMDHADKHAAYAADITYGTNNEFGFDYLRDNMALSKEQRYQRGLNYAIVDEVDSILIDEAGMQHADELLQSAGVIDQDSGLYDSKNLAIVHHLNAALRANGIYQLDVDYIVRDGEVIIVDEFTGRTLAGRRWSDGLHQAVEAKEGVTIQRENQTLATVTFQNLFRMYKKLAGMTGTADTEAFEFQSIYGLEVVVIPTHMPMIRKDNADMIFLSQTPKYNSVIEDIKDCHKRGQPVLVGTTSIEVSELLAALLGKAGVEHEVLNAKQHEREAHIVAQAGAPGQVTIATNMAGRGTDIVLGGSLDVALAALPEDASEIDRQRVKTEWKKLHEQVLAAGGLHIIGTERHESRRIDNQLRGRSGRQGDPGSSRFYLSLEDNLLRIFGGEGLVRWMKRFGMKDDDALEDRMISRQIEKAQRKVEQHNFDIRKHLLEFDDVANDQRKVIYRQRDELLEGDDVSATVADIREDVVQGMVRSYVPADSIDEQWDIAGLDRELESEFGLSLKLKQWVEQQHEIDAAMLLEHVRQAVEELFQAKEAQIGAETMRQLEKHIMLTVVDNAWKDHLSSMDYLRQGIYLVGYAQQDPKQAFKRESFKLFSEMLDRIKAEVVQMLARIHVRSEEEVAAMEAEQQRIAARLRQEVQALSWSACLSRSDRLKTPLRRGSF